MYIIPSVLILMFNVKLITWRNLKIIFIDTSRNDLEHVPFSLRNTFPCVIIVQKFFKIFQKDFSRIINTNFRSNLSEIVHYTLNRIKNSEMNYSDVTNEVINHVFASFSVSLTKIHLRNILNIFFYIHHTFLNSSWIKYMHE